MKNVRGKREGRGIVGRRVIALGDEWTVKAFLPADHTCFSFDRYVLTRETPGRDWETCVTRGAIKFVKGCYEVKA